MALLYLAGVASLTMQFLYGETPKLSFEYGGAAVDLSWSTDIDSYYFVQVSETLEPGSWLYHDFATKGDGSMKSTALDGSPAKKFFRLEFYDSSVSPLPGVLTANFDGDLADNKTELDRGTNVFGLTFSDPDSLFDEWEFFFFGDLSQGDAGNDDADYTDNLEESQLGLDPTIDEKGMALTYTYDGAGRLTAVSGNSTTLAYALDEEGNITSAD